MLMNLLKIKSEIFFFYFLFFFLFTFCVNPFYFFDSMSFLLSILVFIIIFIIYLSCSIMNIFYFKMEVVSMIFFLMMLILFFCFYFFDMFLFYIFFELSVLPIFIFILGWGGDKSKIFAGFYLFFFTFFSSLIFFGGLFFVMGEIGSLSFFNLLYMNFFLNNSYFYYFMILVFMVKMPIFIFHIWLPLAHVESPMMGSMVLASLMLKLGGYGLLRMIGVFFFNFFTKKMYFFVWGIVGAILMSISCFSQVDLKKIVAFSSVSHMSMIFMSSFSLNFMGKLGSICMMLSHGIVSSLMFFGLGVLYYRFFSRSLFILSSLLLIIPLFGLWWFLIGIMNLGFPPFISFFSEFFIFFSMLVESGKFFLLGLILVVFSSIYTVNLMVYFISGLSKNFNLSFEVSLVEHLIFFIHFFFLIMSIFFYWLIQ